ncbi:alpha/beta hydrolase fold-domain-containing protein [Mycotypha africana]|uniref:alpha/beta hydrolase fold-domain-containing protein n=1 Tax=Mycotypha africana TaxID=64632 RepID=UPI0023007D9D|nr:alpha/beta hydrolase fold-domain-containing protein [Mycotypha africana]KAI8973296.1 alpha/beta hydrolase fold-domain-containing protein [Mycotypha africana]
MNTIRAQLRKLSPKAVISILRKVFALPAPAARLILNDVTRPRKSHSSWIYKVKPLKNQHQDWTGCWIGENIKHLNEEDLYKRVQEADIVLFFVHGGGFRIGSCTMYMDTHIAWIKALKEKHNLNCMIMSVDYRLAPEYRYPSPVEDVVKAYEHLLEKLNVKAEKIVVAGDSAGAALLLEMLFITHDPSMFEIITEEEGKDIAQQPTLYALPRPAGSVFISPLVTDETTSESWRINQKHDYITDYTAKVIKRDYFGKVDYRTAATNDEEQAERILGIAKLETGFRDFLPAEVLMYIGNLEVLRDDALQLAMKAEQDGVVWQTVAEDFVHDWFCVREVVKDKAALANADAVFADFCYRTISRNSFSTQCQLTPRESTLLETVHEEGEESDSESVSVTTSTPFGSSSMLEFRLSKLAGLHDSKTSVTPRPSSKCSSEIVFV